MSEYFKKLLKSINDSISNLDYETFEKLVFESIATLKNNNRIIVSGLGKNVPICEKFVGTMLSIGLNAAFMHTNTAIHGDLGLVNKDDLVIILTKSGETLESAILLDALSPKNANLWLITFNENSSLIKKAKKSLILSLDHEGDLWNMVPNNSTTLYLIVLQALAIRISEDFNITINQFKINHPGGNIGERLRNEKK